MDCIIQKGKYIKSYLNDPRYGYRFKWSFDIKEAKRMNEKEVDLINKTIYGKIIILK